MTTSTYIVYETTNLINGKYYIGVHKQCSIEFDDYLGSGTILSKSIEKYGTENFMRETLFVFANKTEAFKKESEIVNQSFINNQNNYNVCIGGCGGAVISRSQLSENARKLWKDSNYRKTQSNIMKNRWKDPEYRKKMEEKDKKQFGNNHPMWGKHHSEETKKIQSELQKGRKKEIVKCPHCEKEGGKPAMIRFHFDNCKYKE